MTEIIPSFNDASVELEGARIGYSIAGDGPPVLLLHGFPQTRALWRNVAPTLAQHFTVVAADLRGYGASSKPVQPQDMSFRLMARDQLALMQHLGFDRFHMVGHDRGARTGHRMALDAPDAVASLTLMDVVPTHHLLDTLPKAVAKAYYHWFFLAQPSPFPETLIGRDPDFFYESCLLGWGRATLDAFDQAALDHYRRAWRDPATIRAMCNDYRAALEVDFAHDAADLGRKVACPALVLYGEEGAMAINYDVARTWRERLTDMQVRPMPGGHFFVDASPTETLAALLPFLAAQPAP